MITNDHTTPTNARSTGSGPTQEAEMNRAGKARGLTKKQARINTARSIGFMLNGAACACGFSNEDLSHMTGLKLDLVRKVLSGDLRMKLNHVSDVATALSVELIPKVIRRPKPTRMVAFP